MTKKEMVYEMISCSTFIGLNERETNNTINKTSKDYIERVYAEFKNDKEHANFYTALILR